MSYATATEAQLQNIKPDEQIMEPLSRGTVNGTNEGPDILLLVVIW